MQKSHFHLFALLLPDNFGILLDGPDLARVDAVLAANPNVRVGDMATFDGAYIASLADAAALGLVEG